LYSLYYNETRTHPRRQAIPLSGTYAGSPEDELGLKVQVNVICEAVAGDSMRASAS
jgi:hypothetical protein